MLLVCSTPHIVSAKSKGPMIRVCSTPHIVSAKSKGPMIRVCSTPHTLMQSPVNLGKELKSYIEIFINDKLSTHLCKTECILFETKRKINLVSEFQISC
jgi:hypothetical protein